MKNIGIIIFVFSFSFIANAQNDSLNEGFDFPPIYWGVPSFNFVRDNVQCEKIILSDSLWSVVYVSAWVNELGYLENPKIVRGNNKIANEEAIRLVMLLDSVKLKHIKSRFSFMVNHIIFYFTISPPSE